MDRLVNEADLDWRTTERARFAMNLLTSAAAPTNFLAGNPAALKRGFETAGRSWLRGSRHFVRDLLHNGGMPAQVDTRPFVIGETVAVTPGGVVYRDEVCEVIQYTPTTATVGIVPGPGGAPPDQQVLLPRPGCRPQLRRVRGRPGPAGVHGQLAQPDG